MLQVVRFYLQEAENWHDFADGNSWLWLEEIEESWNILLHVQLNFNMIKTWPAKLPHVLQALAGDPFKLVDLDEELVHVFDPLVEADVLRAFWKEIRINM